MKNARKATLALATAALFLSTTAIAFGHPMLSVIHGVPDLNVDVYVNGALTLEDFMPGDVAGPLDLVAGPYTIEIRAANSPANSEPVLEATLNLENKTSYTGVAHLDAGGSPKLSAFVDSVGKTDAGKARLTVRHVAAAPAVDVYTNGKIFTKNFVNGGSVARNVPTGIYAAWVAVAGDYVPVIGPAVLKLKAGSAYFVYAWGSGDGGYDLAVQERKVGIK